MQVCTLGTDVVDSGCHDIGYSRRDHRLDHRREVVVDMLLDHGGDLGVGYQHVHALIHYPEQAHDVLLEIDALGALSRGGGLLGGLLVHCRQ